MTEPRLAKKIAIGLGGIEFLFGLAFAAIVVIQAMWLSADPNHSDASLYPGILAIALIAIAGPPSLAYYAERAKSRRTVYTCLAILVLYPTTLIVWANLSGA